MKATQALLAFVEYASQELLQDSSVELSLTSAVPCKKHGTGFHPASSIQQGSDYSKRTIPESCLQLHRCMGVLTSLLQVNVRQHALRRVCCLLKASWASVARLQSEGRHALVTQAAFLVYAAQGSCKAAQLF